jgi:Protein of unknown function (DUF3662)/FHA domain
MNLLKSVENTIARLVEGSFGRAFRSEVRPMELARKLAREMDAHRTVSVSRVYAPSEYVVWLSPEDRERYEGVEGEVIDELCAYLLEHARREELILSGPVRVSFDTDDRLTLGEFGIQARLVRHDGHSVGDGSALDPPDEDEHGKTMIYSTSARVRGPVEEAHAGRAPRALLSVAGRRLLLPPAGGTIGRSRECDVVLDDTGISRRHALIRPGGAGWEIEDLGSTNGLLVNGEEISGRQLLRSGDLIAFGSTEARFELS